MEQADLHIHTTASDGTVPPEDIGRLARGAGLSVAAVTDHDDLTGGIEAAAHAPEGIRVLHGVELSAIARIPCHLVAYGYDPAHSAMAEIMEDLRRRRIRKTKIRVRNLADNDGIILTPREEEWLFSQNSPGRGHIADILVKRGLVDSVPEAFVHYLNHLHNPVSPAVSRIGAEKACDAVRCAGGIIGWAHPLGGEGEEHQSPEAFGEQLDALLQAGIRSLECYYARYSEEEIDFLTTAAGQHDLLISGGSDYHGTKKPDIHLGMLNAVSKPVPMERLTILDALL